ncbi:GNAT family N-acetyltransferase [Thalassospira lucentensis]|uniref:N-acetyltransferase n=1 Tax=Thalassospira lucentensis TaxID=168935 RepID=A0A358HQD9_9PROT|nr:GNAT family N-acetyltransferase [Thalassospira lucentensis]HBU97397.1 N-acetyltransferase [Thalassospira lucentensis]HCW67885.1 N-acetyltransferase [Thalassospira lucentensis]
MSTQQSFEIRLAQKDDVPAIHAMLFQIAATTGCEDKFKSTTDDLARDGFGPSPAFEAMIATDTTGPVALCLYFPSYSTFRGQAGLYIQDLYVAPSHRGAKPWGSLARNLVQAVAKQAHAQGKTYIRLSVDAQNIIGQRFYEKLGMRPADDEKIFVLDGNAFTDLAQNK